MKTEKTIADNLTRSELLELLERFVSQRPGFDLANYGSMSGYRADARCVTRQLNDARAMLAAISWRSGIDADAIRKELKTGGRLTLGDDGRLDYYAGQYWCTEFRGAVCRVLASILWSYWRETAPENVRDGQWADYIRDTARRQLAGSIARRWFN